MQLELFDYRRDRLFDSENQIAHYYDILKETIEILKPEFVFLKTIAISLNILAAMPDLSKTTPMKTNRGTASRVWLFMIPKMRMGRVLNKLGSKKSNAIPRSANKIEVPASVNATG